jgi:hypothetical protein
LKVENIIGISSVCISIFETACAVKMPAKSAVIRFVRRNLGSLRIETSILFGATGRQSDGFSLAAAGKSDLVEDVGGRTIFDGHEFAFVAVRIPEEMGMSFEVPNNGSVEANNWEQVVLDSVRTTSGGCRGTR